MHKLCFTLLLMLLFAGIGMSQISITASNIPVAGLVVTTRGVDSAWLANQNFGQPGANRTWNFANPVYDAFGTESIRYVAPSATPHASKFPAATLAANIGTGNEAAYNFFQVTNSEFSVLGSVAGPSVTTFSPALLAFRFPTNYQSTYNATSNISITGDDLAGTGTASDTTVADAWGSVTTPLGTFQCLRVVSRQTIRINVGGVVPAVIRNVTTDWITTQYRNPVFSSTVNTTSVPALGLSFRSLSGEMLVSATTSVKNAALTAAIQIAPNPVIDRAQLNIQSERQEIVDIQVFSLSGQLVKTLPAVSLTTGSNSIELPVDDLTSGTYTLILHTKNRIAGVQQMIVF